MSVIFFFYNMTSCLAWCVHSPRSCEQLTNCAARARCAARPSCDTSSCDWVVNLTRTLTVPWGEPDKRFPGKLRVRGWGNSFEPVAELHVLAARLGRRLLVDVRGGAFLPTSSFGLGARALPWAAPADTVSAGTHVVQEAALAALAPGGLVAYVTRRSPRNTRQQRMELKARIVRWLASQRAAHLRLNVSSLTMRLLSGARCNDPGYTPNREHGVFVLRGAALFHKCIARLITAPRPAFSSDWLEPARRRLGSACTAAGAGLGGRRCTGVPPRPPVRPGY